MSAITLFGSATTPRAGTATSSAKVRPRPPWLRSRLVHAARAAGGAYRAGREPLGAPPKPFAIEPLAARGGSRSPLPGHAAPPAASNPAASAPRSRWPSAATKRQPGVRRAPAAGEPGAPRSPQGHRRCEVPPTLEQARTSAADSDQAPGTRPAGLRPGAPPSNNHWPAVLLALGNCCRWPTLADSLATPANRSHGAGEGRSEPAQAPSRAPTRAVGLEPAIEQGPCAPILQRRQGALPPAPAQQQPSQLPAQAGCNERRVSRLPGGIWPVAPRPGPGHQGELRLAYGSSARGGSRGHARAISGLRPGSGGVGRSAHDLQRRCRKRSCRGQVALPHQGDQSRTQRTASQKIVPPPQSPWTLLNSSADWGPAPGPSKRLMLSAAGQIRYLRAAGPAPAGSARRPTGYGRSRRGGQIDQQVGPSRHCSSIRPWP